MSAALPRVMNFLAKTLVGYMEEELPADQLLEYCRIVLERFRRGDSGHSVYLCRNWSDFQDAWRKTGYQTSYLEEALVGLSRSLGERGTEVFREMAALSERELRSNFLLEIENILLERMGHASK